ncbi:MAG: hypothetical protein J0I12_25035 [Candidatus Eremiobacteraeota bacterium]|nr:hypothetical protein [Candidatus Eremiobacteraeota bacterium]
MKTLSVPTRLFADWSPEPSRQVSSPSGAGGASQWSSLRQADDTRQLADRARSYILSMLKQESGPRYPGQ